MKRELKFRAWHPLNKEIVYEKKGQNFGYGDYTRSNILKDFEDDNIMQFTGLRDKNGKEIYEGDIMLWDEVAGGVVTVIYDPPEFTLRHKSGATTGSLMDLTKFEVIGNIFENPELLIEPVK